MLVDFFSPKKKNAAFEVVSPGGTCARYATALDESLYSPSKSRRFVAVLCAFSPPLQSAFSGCWGGIHVDKSNVSVASNIAYYRPVNTAPIQSGQCLGTFVGDVHLTLTSISKGIQVCLCYTMFHNNKYPGFLSPDVASSSSSLILAIGLCTHARSLSDTHRQTVTNADRHTDKHTDTLTMSAPCV